MSNSHLTIETNKLLNKLSNNLYDFIKEKATEHLKNNDQLGSFCMSMGTYFFSYKEDVIYIDEDGEEWDIGGDIVNDNEKSYTYNHNMICQEIDEVISEFDSTLKVTGMPLKLDKDPFGNIDFTMDW
jgi:hypothetical protein